MTGEKTNRRVYSAEELHRLRGTCSQPRLREAIEEHDGEDAELVKEHVLRGSKSFTARSFKSRTSGISLRVPSSNKENRSTTDAENSRPSSGQRASSNLPVLGEIVPNGRLLRSGVYKAGLSPTPSLKKKKAEAIVKAHGSPQHIRVTAGGRIVPSEQSPLCHPRYGYSAIKTNGGLIKFAPNHPMGKTQWTQATQNGFVAQDINGRLCQIVNGTILPLNEVDGAVRLYVPAPNLNISSRGSSFGPSMQEGSHVPGTRQRATSQGKPLVTADPPVAAQSNALELEYSKLEHELKEIDKTEVMHGRTMGKAAKDALFGKRRELVTMLDNIRKAIKSIKNMPSADAPASPRAMQNRQSISPPRNRLPPFLQQRMQQNNEFNMQPIPSSYGMYFAPQYNGLYGFQSTPSPDAPYHGPPFGMQQPPVFVPPPPFDGSMAYSFGSYQDPMLGSAPHAQPISSNVPPCADAPTTDQPLPQTDGACSFADLQRLGSPGRSRALDIKAPETKSASVLKSGLNPMSPAYKPGSGFVQETRNAAMPSTKSVKDRALTPLSPLHQLKPVTASNKPLNKTDDSISPTKKSPHLHSSSISSFETADFFPRNTREYSTRKLAYPESIGQSEDKENISPGQSPKDHALPNGNSDTAIVQNMSNNKHSPAAVYDAPSPPPGTPVTCDSSTSKPGLPIKSDGTSFEHQQREIDFRSMLDRCAHNLSPKSRRQEYLFVQENPSQFPSEASSSPERYQACREATSSPFDSSNFPEVSKDWIEGCRSGLARKPIEADRVGDYLTGYCAGLLKSKPSKVSSSTGSPVKSTSRRPSPLPIQSHSATRPQHYNNQQPASSRPPFETQLDSMDTLKQAVFAPHNEDAVLTPAADGPHVNESPFNLGAWAKNQDLANATESLARARGDGPVGVSFPYRTGSMLKRQGVLSDDDTVKPQFRHCDDANDRSIPSVCAGSDISASVQSIYPSSFTGKRVSSMTSIDSNIYRQWPVHRVFSSNLDWKSVGSVAHAAGFASGYFANDQYDGAAQRRHHVSTTRNDAMASHTRFREGSLDGITNPPNSPRLASPPMSPLLTPTNSPIKDKKKPSPGKSNSPAKAKFEHIAEKVGIKVSGGKKEDEGSPNSPQGKRRWRDVWRNARKETSKDQTSFAPYA